jgi:hypothetical protein
MTSHRERRGVFGEAADHYEKAAPGGLLALFWNAFLLTDTALHTDLALARRV